MQRDDDVDEDGEGEVAARRARDRRVDLGHLLPDAQQTVLVDVEVDEERCDEQNGTKNLTHDL